MIPGIFCALIAVKRDARISRSIDELHVLIVDFYQSIRRQRLVQSQALFFGLGGTS